MQAQPRRVNPTIYNDFPPNHQIWKVSNPQTVRDNYHRIFEDFIKEVKEISGIDSEVYLSSRKNKKNMVFNGEKMIHFGDLRYEDFTKHQDEERQLRYLQRFPVYRAENNSIFSPYYLSLMLLW